MEQQTVSGPFTVAGVGIHRGVEARVTVRPAPANTGRRFLSNGISIQAQVRYVVDTTRSTTLGSDGVTISTVEHLLSALAGCGIDNCLIDVDGPEIPILDGSALPFVDAINAAGIERQGVPARTISISRTISVSSGGSELRAEPADELYLEVTTEFDEWPAGTATVAVHGADGIPESYAGAIAPARTFAFRREVEMLIAAGLAKGGSLDNALIISPPNEYSTPLRVPSEWCAHKLLDVIGDLALLDARPAMSIHARRPGHRINTALAQSIYAKCREQTP